MKKINVNNLDFLRFVFAFTVTLAHLIKLSEVKAFQSYVIFFDTRLAINGFFVISGFLIAKSYENSTNIKAYLIKRIRRILPAYIFIILLCALFFCFVSTNSINQYFLNNQFWKYLIANLTFQNYIEPCLPGVFQDNLICAVNGSLWTIKLEEAFYLMLPVLYFITKSKKARIVILSILVYILSISYFNYFVSIDMYRIAKQLPGALAFFMSGIIFYRNFEFLIKWKHYLIVPSLLIFLLEYYIYNTHIFYPISYSFLVFYLAYNFKFLNNFGKYGDITYGVYIYHFPIIQVFVYFGFFKIYDPFFVSIVVLLLVIILAFLSWHFLELQYLSDNRKKRHKKIKF